jgi:hypothetical protein
MQRQKSGFVYIWFDRKHKRYYVGCHWGFEDDGYICSSSWMKKAYKIRPYDFKRRFLKRNIVDRADMFLEEERWLNMIKPEEIKPINQNPRYYNLNLGSNNVWHKYDEHIKTVGEKISKAKKGKSTGPRDPEIGKKISEVKKKNFAKRQEELGYKFTEEHRKIMSEARKGTVRSEEAKEKTSKTLNEYWAVPGRKKGRKKQHTMSREEQDRLASQRLKSNWADPEWAVNQRKKLSEGAKNRPPRSEESRRKTSEAFARRRLEKLQ